MTLRRGARALTNVDDLAARRRKVGQMVEMAGHSAKSESSQNTGAVERAITSKCRITDDPTARKEHIKRLLYLDANHQCGAFMANGLPATAEMFCD
jgi:hypothetical protein